MLTNSIKHSIITGAGLGATISLQIATPLCPGVGVLRFALDFFSEREPDVNDITNGVGSCFIALPLMGMFAGATVGLAAGVANKIFANRMHR